MARTSAAAIAQRNGVAEYRRRLSALYTDAEAWLRDAGLSCRREQMSLNEEMGGRYEVSRLVIRTADRHRVAELEPVGAHVVGACGRVDLRGAFDRIPILYLLRGGLALRTRISGDLATTQQRVTPLFRGVDRDGWYSLEREEPSRARHIDRHHFLELVRRVSEHALEERP